MIDLNATKLDAEVRVRRRLGFAPANTITTSTAPRKIWYRAAIFFLFLFTNYCMFMLPSFMVN